MRIVAGILLIIAFALHVLAGVGAITRSKAEAFLAQEAHMVRTGDLSSVSGDLVDEETLKKEQQGQQARKAEEVDTSTATRLMVVGVVLLVLAAGQLLASVQVLRRRIGGLVLAVIGVSMAAGVADQLLHGPSALGGAGLGSLLAALLLSILSRSRSSAQAT